MNLEGIRPVRSISAAPDASRGMALVIGMIFLLITSLIALTAMSGVVMQERMAGNLRSVSIAQAAAENALRAGELYLSNIISRGEEITGDCGSGGHRIFNRENIVCDTGLVDAFRGSRDAPGDAGGFAQDYPVSLISASQLGDHEYAGMAGRPRFVIEHLGQMYSGGGREWDSDGSYTSQAARVYRITGRGVGVSSGVVRVLESYFGMFAGGGAGGVCPDGITPVPTPPATCPT
jgi:type IV pilus assembly protein PilX